MKILAITTIGGFGTVNSRVGALRRLGHDVDVINPRHALPPFLLADYWRFHTAAFGFAGIVKRHVLRRMGESSYDLVFVDIGDLVGAPLVRALKRKAKLVVCFNQDNPFAGRDGHRWRLFLKALPLYDLLAFPRDSSVEAARQHGAQHVIRIFHPADELTARPIALSDEDRRKFGSEVAFIGSWMPERGPFMKRLLELGVPLRIFGPRWHKAPEIEFLREHLTPGPLEGDDYVKAIAASKISLALLSKGNEDLHTTRSTEIPAIGSLLCGERTSDHLEMYVEDEEAVFFDTADECARKCFALLSDPERLGRIAAAGQRRAHRNGTFNETQLNIILQSAQELIATGN